MDPDSIISSEFQIQDNKGTVLYFRPQRMGLSVSQERRVAQTLVRVMKRKKEKKVRKKKRNQSAENPVLRKFQR